MKYQIELPCNIAIYGATRTGKTYLTKKLLREQLLAQIDVLIILSTTSDLSGDFDEFKDNTNPDHGLVVQKFNAPELFPRVINEVVQQSEGLHKNHYVKKKDIPRTLIILDDCIGLNVLRYRGLVDKLSTRNRHLQISFLVLCQRITGVPRTFRVNTRVVILFNTPNLTELERLLEEYTPKRYRMLVRDSLPTIFDTSYNFILVDTFSTRQRERLYLNGDSLLLDYLHEKMTEEKEDA